jgi:hypothetical protein
MINPGGKRVTSLRNRMICKRTSLLSLLWADDELVLTTYIELNLRRAKAQGAPQPRNSKGKSVTFQFEKTSTYGLCDIGQGVCELIRRTSKLSPRRLHLLVRNSKLQYYPPKDAIHDSYEHEFIPLSGLIAGESPLALSGEKQLRRYFLSFLIASAFLQTYGTAWSPGCWTKEKISFRYSKTDSGLDITRPYLSTQFQLRPGNESKKYVEEDLRVHPYPEILSLGIVPLQVYLGEPIEAKRPRDRQEVDPAIYDVDADRVPAHKMLQTCDDSLSAMLSSNACHLRLSYPSADPSKPRPFDRKSTLRLFIRWNKYTLLDTI